MKKKEKLIETKVPKADPSAEVLKLLLRELRLLTKLTREKLQAAKAKPSKVKRVTRRFRQALLKPIP